MSSSLAFRIGALLTLALLPLGLIAVAQTWTTIDTAREAYNRSLAAQTMRAAAPEAEAITRTFGIARGLATAMPALQNDLTGCVKAMQNTVARQPNIIFAGFVGADQTTVCNNLARSLDFSDNPDSDRVFAAGTADVKFNPSGDASGQSVVIVSQPVYAGPGDVEGFVSLSFPTTPLNELRAQVMADPNLTLITFDGEGRLLTAAGERERVAALVPAEGGLEALVGQERRVFSAISVDGQRRDYALAPIVQNRAYALGIWSEPALDAFDLPVLLNAAAFPFLMWIASLLVAILALQHQVVRPVRALRLRMRGFADARTVFRASSVKDAPRELLEIGETFEAVADKVIRDEAELEEKVHERDALLREVHHRVKNNLQLMSSIINMQIRQDLGEQAEDALRRIQDRLASLAKFHQDLYESSSLSKLRADQLLEDLARQTISLNADPERRIDLHMDMDEITLQPDQASPLAMLLNEALRNSLKYACNDPGTPLFVSVSLKQHQLDDRNSIVLEIANSLYSDPGDFGGIGLGKRLIAAFASQMDGTLEQGRVGDAYVTKVSFQKAN